MMEFLTDQVESKPVLSLLDNELPKVAVIVPHHKGLHPVVSHLLAGGFSYPSFDVYLRNDPTPGPKPKNLKKRYQRLSSNRDFLRRQVLMDPEVEWVLSLDSDVLPPPDVIERLLRWTKGPEVEGHLPRVVGGWYPVKGVDTLVGLNDDGSEACRRQRARWVGGCFESPGVFRNYETSRDYKTTLSHLAPLGCCLIHRSILEWAHFEPGFGENQVSKDPDTGHLVAWGECLAFGKRVVDQGEVIGLARDVVCQHLDW